MSGKDSFIRSYLLFDGVIFISGVLYFLVFLFLQLIESVLQKGVLLLMLFCLFGDFV